MHTPPLKKEQVADLLFSYSKTHVREVESISIDTSGTTMIRAGAANLQMIETKDPDNHMSIILVFNPADELIGKIYPGPGMSVWYKRKRAE